MAIRAGTTAGGLRAATTTFEAWPEEGITILNGPFEAHSGETVTVRTNDEPDPAATYAGLSATLTDITPDGDEFTSQLTIPDREAEGLGIGYTHFIVVTSAADAEDEATTQNTLQPEPDVHVWHVIDGYDALEDKSESIWWDGDDENSVTPADGWLGIVWNPNNLTDLTVDAAGIASADDFGDIERQLFEPEAGDGVDGQYTEVGTVTVEDATPALTARTNPRQCITLPERKSNRVTIPERPSNTITME